MKRGVKFADRLTDEPERQQQADASPSNTGGGSDHLVGTWKTEQDLNGNDKKPIQSMANGPSRPLGERRFSTASVDASKLKEKEEVATCCSFGVEALHTSVDFVASALGLKEPAEPDVLDSSHFTVANAKLTDYQKGCAKRALQEARLHEKTSLRKSEVMVMLRLLGHFPETWRIDCAVQELRMKTLDNFTVGEALHIWTYFLFFHEEELQMLKRAFQFFDRDSSGHITFEEMRDSNRELEDPLSDDEIRQFIDLLDKNGDGHLQYEDFFGIAENILGGDNNSAFNVEPHGREIVIPENSMRLDRAGLPPDTQAMHRLLSNRNGNSNVKQPYLTREYSALRTEAPDLQVQSYRSASDLLPPAATHDNESEALTKYDSRPRSDRSCRAGIPEEPLLCTTPRRQTTLKDGSVSAEATATSYDNFIPGGAKAVSTPEELDPSAFNITRDDGKLTNSNDNSDDASTRASV